MKPRRLARTVLYENPWVSLYLDEVEFPNGRLVKRHHLLHFDRPSVGAIVENAAGQVAFVLVPRYTTGKTEWELPAGGVEDGETVLEAARREAKEETGFNTVDHRLLFSYYPNPGIADKVFHVVHARAAGEPDGIDVEVERVRWLGRSEVLAGMQAGEFSDGFTLTALLYYFQFIRGD